MKTIGITGGIASGKSTVAQIIREMGYPVINSDLIARQVVEPGQPAYREVIAVFGPEILLPDKNLDRKKLAEIVFADAKRRSELEQIIHPAVQEEIRAALKQIAKAGPKMGFVEVPLLYEIGMETFFDAVWVVAVHSEIQLERLVERDRVTKEQANQRLAAQLAIEEKIKRADLVIENNGNYEELKGLVVRSVKRCISIEQGIWD